MTTPSVQYVYADGSNNTIRPTAVVYPNGRTLHASYGTPGGMDDAASRVAALIDDDGTTHLADYSYLGLGSPVIVDYTQPQITFTLVGTAGGNDPNTGDIYHGLDRFGRIKDAYWRNHGNNTDSARIQYGYDRASNRTHRHDPVAAAATAQFDELYQYDAIHRLKEMQRGTLNGPKTGLTAESFAQCWSLDATGNWKGFRQDDTGSGTWDLIQARAANPVNEITGISETTGPSWNTPAYDTAGNMTTVPKPADPTTSYAATYDAWNRLVKLMDGSDLVQENQYDARNFRIVRKDYTAGVLSETRHFYYTSGWQCLEERLGTSPASAPADRQHIWGLRYIDDLILRDRFHSSPTSSSSSSGSPFERLYALQDGNWNVIALADALGTIQERFAYTPYGVPLFLDAAFVPQSTSDSEWETLYAGYRYDLASGFYPVRYRFLQPVLGTWLSRDPIGYMDEQSLYGYGKGMPLSVMDPLGLQPHPEGAFHPEPLGPIEPLLTRSQVAEAYRARNPGNWMKTKVVAKSFIARDVSRNVGHFPIKQYHSPIFNVLYIWEFAAETDYFFSEDPQTDRSSAKDYRLFTEVVAYFKCDCNHLSDHQVLTKKRGGQEFTPAIAGTINMTSVQVSMKNRSSMKFRWTGFGRPNLLLEPRFQMVSPRVSTHIWHTVEFEVFCENGKGFHKEPQLSGSAFPSHRVWTNGHHWSSQDKTQGAFSNLWKFDPNDFRGCPISVMRDV